MVIRKSPDLRYSQVTPRTIYLNRRRFLAAGSVALGALRGMAAAAAGSKLTATKSPFSTSEEPTPLEAITHYNNFYEFGTDKEDPSRTLINFARSPGR